MKTFSETSNEMWSFPYFSLLKMHPFERGGGHSHPSYGGTVLIVSP